MCFVFALCAVLNYVCAMRSYPHLPLPSASPKRPPTHSLQKMTCDVKTAHFLRVCGGQGSARGDNVDNFVKVLGSGLIATFQCRARTEFWEIIPLRQRFFKNLKNSLTLDFPMIFQRCRRHIATGFCSLIQAQNA